MTVAPPRDETALDALVESLCGDLSSIRAPRGSQLNARSWAAEAPLRMLLNNLDREVAERPEELVVYGGSGRAARSHDGVEGDRARAARARRRRDAARAVGQAGRGLPDDARRAARPDRQLAARPEVGDVGRVPPARGRGPDDVRADDGRLVDLHRHAGDPAGHLPDVRGGGPEALRHAVPRGADGPDRRARRHGRRAAARGDARRAPRSSASRSIPRGSSAGSQTRYLDEATESLDDALARVRAAAAEGRALSVGLLGNAADVVPELARRGEHFDLVTDQTAAHDPLTGYIPTRAVRRGGVCVARVRSGRVPAPRRRVDRRARARRCSSTSGSGSYVFDYGNNLRGEAEAAGVSEAFSYPGFVPAYIRPLFCRGIGPFRWAALSGDPADIQAIDDALRELFPGDELLQRWLELAPGTGRVPGAARPHLLARLRRPRQGGPGDQRARPQRARAGAGRDRARPPRRRLRRLAVPRDRGDARRLRRDRRLADPERARQRGGGCDVGQRPSRRRRRDRQLDPRGHGRARRRQRRGRRAARARADDRPRHGRRPPPRRRLPRGDRPRRPSTGSTRPCTADA